MRRWLIERRKSRELTQTCIAGRAGISRSYYTQIERRQRSPSIPVAKKLAEILEFDWTCFYDDESNPSCYPAGQTDSAP